MASPHLKAAVIGAVLASAATVAVLSAPLSTSVPSSVFLEDMTWLEVKAALDSGKRGVIVPTAGHEQNGPHIVLGKHRYIVQHTAGQIAEDVGTLLVAPVVVFVPEGDVEPKPTGHMAFAGTISVPAGVFADILEHTARSLRAHGFTDIFFVGDSRDNQPVQAEVAQRLTLAWRPGGTRVHHVGDYYAANGQTDWLLGEGESLISIGTHAGIRDTSEMLAIHPDGVRQDMLAPKWGMNLWPAGSDGDPKRASAERGRRLLDLKIAAAVRQIRTQLAARE